MRRALHRICLTLCLALSLFIAWRWRQSHVDPRSWLINPPRWMVIEIRGRCTIIGGRVFDDLYQLIFNIPPARGPWPRITSIPIQVGPIPYDPALGMDPLMALDMAKLNRLIEIISKLPSPNHNILSFPFWLLLLIAASYPALTLALFTHRKIRAWFRIAPGHCPTCNYDLRASKVRCPECGTPILTPIT